MRYPPIDAFTEGLLDVGDGQALHYELSGRPDGKPAVVLHGGPGGRSRPGVREQFDPRAYLIIQFDQRGAGRSTPSLADFDTDLTVNTTAHLVADIERIRIHLGIEKWLVYGASWGATLAQAYTQRHPDRVTEVVLAAVTMTRPSEVEWLARAAGRFFPAEWEQFVAGLPASDRDGNLALGYAALLSSPDPAVRDKAAMDWCGWEQALISLEPASAGPSRFDDPRFRMGLPVR